MLRSVSNQITGEAAVQRNKMAEEFKRQGYRADVAYDMANFQIIGHHQPQNLGPVGCITNRLLIS